MKLDEAFRQLVDHLVANGFFMEQAVEILERKLIESALARAENNRSEASRLLGIHRNTLQKKMRHYKLDGGSERRKPLPRKSPHVAKARKPRAKAS